MTEAVGEKSTSDNPSDRGHEGSHSSSNGKARNSIRVAIFPWGSTPIDYQVSVEVARFERQPAGENLLVARWSVLRDNGKEILLTRNSSFSEPAAAGDYEATVSAQSRVLAEFSREIAAAITAISQKTADR